jgi:murein DD-endopeptidase MepM/ murein hydrolase activator NlpD
MKEEEIKKKSWLKKLRSKYRLVILNDVTFEEKLSLRLSRLNVFVVVGIGSILLISLTTVIIAFTPLREYIPGYSSTTLRKRAIQNAVLVDSLRTVIGHYDQYLAIINGVVSGEPIDWEKGADTTRTVVMNEDLSNSKRDSAFRTDIEQQDRFDVLESKTDPISRLNFFPPIKGVVSDHFDSRKKHYGVDITAKENEPILAALSGTVIFSSWTTDGGYVIAIQHPDNLFTVYRHNSVLLKKQGDIVKVGEAIAIIGNSGHLTTGPHLHFELWYAGTPLDPEKYFSF